jgi:hypothetical protein
MRFAGTPKKPFVLHLNCAPFGYSFSFGWPRFSERFHAETTEMLNQALNKGNKPPIIQDKIEVVKLEMGTQVNVLFSALCEHLLISLG